VTGNVLQEDNDLFVVKEATTVLAKPLDMKRLEDIFKEYKH
jgi:hypothetical protein